MKRWDNQNQSAALYRVEDFSKFIFMKTGLCSYDNKKNISCFNNTVLVSRNT